MNPNTKVSVTTQDGHHFIGRVTKTTTKGMYIVDANKKYRQDQDGEWFSDEVNSIKKIED